MITLINENQKKAAAIEAAPNQPKELLKAHNTEASNQRIINLLAMIIEPETINSLRHKFSINKTAPRIKKLRSIGDAKGDVRTNQYSHKSIKRNAIAKFVLRGAK